MVTLVYTSGGKAPDDKMRVEIIMLILATQDPAIAAQADRIVRLGSQRKAEQDR